jgi:N6-L-threonylcarbamoyladenine synthase
MYFLGIETSCDDTGMAIYDADNGLVGHSLASQAATHQQYGGIVPELASRDHVNNLVPLLEHVLCKTNINIEQINRIAYTKGPGLIGSLLTGACFAKSLAYSLCIPAIGIHHLEAHILVAMMESPQLKFPFLVMLVSGGHTMLVHAKSLGDYEILSQTVDDAIGEAFDKTAKLMKILYPGGPELANIADHCPDNLKTILSPFPKPLCDKSNLNFSFSGLKTHALNIWNKNNSLSQDSLRYAIAYRFQEATIATLIHKIKLALKKTNLTRLVLAGGVAANQHLRNELKKLVNLSNITLPAKEFCTDNGAMIAYAASLYNEDCFLDDSFAIRPRARWARFREAT